MQLAAPHIDGVDMSGTARQAHLGESASRSADIEHDGTGHINFPQVQRVNQL